MGIAHSAGPGLAPGGPGFKARSGRQTQHAFQCPVSFSIESYEKQRLIKVDFGKSVSAIVVVWVDC